jgi:hypothetical protein
MDDPMGHRCDGLPARVITDRKQDARLHAQSYHATSALIITTYRIIGGQSTARTRRKCAQGTTVCLDAHSGRQVA